MYWILFCYLQQCHSIDLFSYKDSWPSPEVFLELALKFFFLELSMVLGTHVVLYMTARFFENRVFPSKWGKQAKARDLRMYRKAQLFFSVLYFFINLGYNESLYYCNSCMLEQISYLEKFWFLRYGPKCSCPIRLQDFSINCRALKLVVSQEINEIN